MRKQRSGHVVSISSTAGIVGQEFCSAYAASKFGLEGWMESLRFEVEPFGIHTTIVEPGFFRTELLTKESTAYADLSIDDYAERTAETRPAWEAMSGKQTERSRQAREGAGHRRRPGAAAAALRRRRRRGRRPSSRKRASCSRRSMPTASCRRRSRSTRSALDGHSEHRARRTEVAGAGLVDAERDAQRRASLAQRRLELGPGAQRRGARGGASPTGRRSSAAAGRAGRRRSDRRATRETNRPDLSRVNVMRGRTAIVTGVLRRLRQLAWYVVAILGRARYCHAPFTPVRMVATARGEPSPYGCA